MKQVEKVVLELEELREELNNLINEKIKLTDSEVVETSQKLDAVLNVYNHNQL